MRNSTETVMADMTDRSSFHSHCNGGDAVMTIFKRRVAQYGARLSTSNDEAGTSLRLITLVAGVALAGAATLAAGDPSTASAQVAAASPAAVGVTEKANKFNELGRHIDYQVEMHEGTNM